MITRPLDLAAKLRGQPRDFDFIFFVNGGLIILFFFLFGSRFVLSPGLEVNFKVPDMHGALAGGGLTTSVISVKRPGLIFADVGALNFAQLKEWLRAQAKEAPEPSLLVRVNAGVPVAELIDISSVAREAGFVRVLWGAEEPMRLQPENQDP